VMSLTTPPYLGLVGAATARLRGSAHVHWVMDLYPDALVAHGMLAADGLVFRWLAVLARRQWRNAGAVVSLGPEMAERLRPYVGANSAWVPLWGPGPLPSSPPARGRLRRVRGWDQEDLVLMWSGNLGLGHRFGEFLDAAGRLGASGPLWAFVGQGVRRPEIELFRARHYAARIELLPPVPREYLLESLASADLHLASLSRAWQGLILPSKLPASFSAGRPIIFVGPRDNEVAHWIEESGGGWRVGEDDVEGLLAAVEEARDPSERARRGEAALAYAHVHFDPARNVARIADFVEGVVRRP
jgi:colanic acid biosynthesis glycosyl transferase WcaI